MSKVPTAEVDPTHPPENRADRTVSSTEHGPAQTNVATRVFDEGARYVISREFARGGLGRISEAHDARLGRRVAVKELIKTSPVLRDRFAREVAITARLQHPAIVPVHDAGVWDGGQPYYVMKLISDGRTLKEAVADAKDLDSRLALLPNVIAVADAIAFAHSRDIIHRDLKPSNILVGPFGETVVIDWGLAKDLACPSPTDDLGGDPYRTAAPDLTSSGSILGTPQYMAPEQAHGVAVDKRADVYSLGAVLYHVLAGVAPFKNASPRDIIEQVRDGSPMALAEAQPGIPTDLVAIVDKAMDRRADKRYADAAELADDLKRFQTGQLVRAHHYSTARLIGRWVRRHRVPVTVAALSCLVLLAFGVASIRRIRRERAVAVAGRNALILQQAYSAQEHDPTLAIEWLKVYPLDASDWPKAQAIAAAAVSRGVARHILPGGPVYVFALSPDSKHLFTAGMMQPIRQWNLATGSLIGETWFGRTTKQVRVSPDGQRVAVCDFDGDIWLWTPTTGDRRLLGNQGSHTWDVVFSPDGRLLVSAGEGAVDLWDLESGRPRVLSGNWGAVGATVFTPDAKLLATASDDGVIRLWDLEHGGSRELRGHRGAINDASISPDGAYLVSSGDDHSVRLWNLSTGVGRVLGTHDAAAWAVRFAPNGRMIASAGVDHQVRVWGLHGEAPRVLAGHTDNVMELAFSPDSATLASCGRDGQVRLRDMTTGESQQLLGHRGSVHDVAFTADGHTLVSSGDELNTRVWSIRPHGTQIVDRHDGPAFSLARSNDGRFLASAGKDGVISVLSLLHDNTRRSLKGHGEDLNGLAFSRDGDVLASTGWDETTRLWNPSSGAERVLATKQSRALSLSFSANGRWLARSGYDGVIRLWDPTSGAARGELTGHRAEVWSVGFSPDSELLASAGGDGTVRLWHLDTKDGRTLGTYQQPMTVVLFSSDGKTLASGGEDGVIRIFDVASGRERDLRGHREKISRLLFSPDGQRLISTSWDKTVRVWDLATGKATVVRGPSQRVRALAIAPDGRSFAAGSDDGHVYTWDFETFGRTVLDGKAAIRSVIYSSDGRTLFTAGEDGAIREWTLDATRSTPAAGDALHAWLQEQTTAALSAEPTETDDAR